MSTVFTKLNLGAADTAYVIDAPVTFEPKITSLAATVPVLRSLAGVRGAAFALAFATTEAQVDAFAATVTDATEGDAVVWIAYPK